MNRREEMENRSGGTSNRRDGTENRTQGTENRREETLNRREGTDNRREGRKNRREGTQNRREETENVRERTENSLVAIVFSKISEKLLINEIGLQIHGLRNSMLYIRIVSRPASQDAVIKRTYVHIKKSMSYNGGKCSRGCIGLVWPRTPSS